MERLDKILSNENLLSRSETKKAIKNKEIKVNGVVVKSSDIKIDEINDIITYKDIVVTFHKFIYIMINKPLGVVSATNDKNEKTVIDLINNEYYRKDLFPCGRLDKDTSGLLIITNDGESSHKRLSPKNHVEKEYLFKLSFDLDNHYIEELESGVTLEDGLKTKPSKIKMFNKKEGSIIITEGKYHEIRRMFAYCHNNVEELKRISFGSIKLDTNLKPGEYRLLTEDEIKSFTL